jgi:hypothetical protein
MQECATAEVADEGSSIGEAHLRQVQDRPSARRRSGDLRQPEAQAETGVIGDLVSWSDGECMGEASRLTNSPNRQVANSEGSDLWHV